MKDELKGEIIDEFVGLKSKMHSLVTTNDKKLTRSKEINKKIKHK